MVSAYTTFDFITDFVFFLSRVAFCCNTRYYYSVCDIVKKTKDRKLWRTVIAHDLKRHGIWKIYLFIYYLILDISWHCCCEIISRTREDTDCQITRYTVLFEVFLVCPIRQIFAAFAKCILANAQRDARPVSHPDRSMPRCVSILFHVDLSLKTGKEPMHVHRLTKMKTYTTSRNLCLQYSFKCFHSQHRLIELIDLVDGIRNIYYVYQLCPLLTLLLSTHPDTRLATRTGRTTRRRVSPPPNIDQN